ncbi:MAG TPA: hypothetical protein VFC00_36880 [Micromonosporaceae bacterium]|nr:hypothetical protein [Micromonosporaceae bacterium]
MQPGRVRQRSNPVERAGDDRTVARELVRVGIRYAEKVGDDRDRQRRRQRGHQIELSRRHDLIQQAADGRLDPRAVARDLLGAERRLGEAAQPGVVRRIHIEE